MFATGGFYYIVRGKMLCCIVYIVYIEVTSKKYIYISTSESMLLIAYFTYSMRSELPVLLLHLHYSYHYGYEPVKLVCEKWTKA